MVHKHGHRKTEREKGFCGVSMFLGINGTRKKATDLMRQEAEDPPLLPLFSLISHLACVCLFVCVLAVLSSYMQFTTHTHTQTALQYYACV